MSDQSAGREGLTPDFVPGWFRRRDGFGAVEEIREAVRLHDGGDFPISFLRSGEMAHPARPPQRGVCIGNARHSEMELAVPPGYWIVRNVPFGDLQLWSNDDFRRQWARMDHRGWVPAVEREPILYPGSPGQLPREGRENLSEAGGPRPFDQPAHMERQAFGNGEDVPPDGWEGTPPAEGTRRALIRDTIGEQLEALDEGTAVHRRELASQLADAIEGALLGAHGHRGCAECDVDRERALAECFRLTGADPDGASDRFLAGEAVDEVRRFRKTYDEISEAIDEAHKTLDRAAGPAPQSMPLVERCNLLVDRYLFEAKTGAVMADREARPPEDREEGPTEESYEDRLLREREEARAGEDHFKAQRDSALRLVRWLIGDVVDTRFASDEGVG